MDRLGTLNTRLLELEPQAAKVRGEGEQPAQPALQRRTVPQRISSLTASLRVLSRVCLSAQHESEIRAIFEELRTSPITLAHLQVREHREETRPCVARSPAQQRPRPGFSKHSSAK